MKANLKIKLNSKILLKIKFGKDMMFFKISL